MFLLKTYITEGRGLNSVFVCGGGEDWIVG